MSFWLGVVVTPGAKVIIGAVVIGALVGFIGTMGTVVEFVRVGVLYKEQLHVMNVIGN